MLYSVYHDDGYTVTNRNALILPPPELCVYYVGISLL